MGLRLNHISASFEGPDGLLDGRNRGAIGVSGSMYFETVLDQGASAATDVKAGFAGHKDAAYIFSGSATADGTGLDKTVFLGDVVVSGSFASAAGSFVDVSGTALDNQISVFTNGDTIEGDADFTFDKASHSFQIGANSGDAGVFSLSAGDFRLFHDGNDDIGISTGDYKFSLTGSKAAGVGLMGVEIGSDAGVVIGQGGGADGNKDKGFIAVRALAANADVSDANAGSGDLGGAALMVRADAGGLLLSGALKTKVHGKTGLVLDSKNTVVLKSESTMDINVGSPSVPAGLTVDASTISIDGVDDSNLTVTASGKDLDIKVLGGGDQHLNLSSAGTSADAVDIAASAGGVDISSAGSSATSPAINVESSNAAGLVKIKSAHVAGQAIHIDANAHAGSELDLDSGILRSNSQGATTFVAGAGFSATSTTFGVDASSTVTIDSDAGMVVGATDINIDADGGAGSGEIAIDTNDTTNGVKIAVANANVPVTIGNSSSTVTIGDNLVITGDLTVSGDTVTQDVSTLTVEDPLIKLASGNGGSDLVDIGFYGMYDVGGTDKYTGLFRDQDDSGKYHLFKDLQAEPTTTVNKGGTGYTVATLVANLEGDVTGTSSKVTVTDSTVGHTNFPIVFHDESQPNALLDSQFLEINPGNKAIIMSGSADDAAMLFVDANAALTLLANDAGGANAHIILDADGDVKLDPQTGVTKFMLNGGASDMATLTVGANGATTLASVDAVGTSGHLTVDAGGDLILDSTTGAVDLKHNGTAMLEFTIDSSGNPIVQPADSKDLEFGYNDSGSDVEIFRLDRNGGTGTNGSLLMATGQNIEFGAAARNIVDSGSDLIVSSGGDIALTAGAQVQIPATIPLNFDGTAGDDFIQSDGTNLTVGVAGGDIVLDPAGDVVISGTSQKLEFGAANSGEHITGDGNDLTIASGRHVVLSATSLQPDADNDVDLGSTSKRFRNIFTGDLNLRNDRGDWTLIEEEDFISFRNNMTGRRFRMVMEDITGTGTYGPGNDGEM